MVPANLMDHHFPLLTLAYTLGILHSQTHGKTSIAGSPPLYLHKMVGYKCTFFLLKNTVFSQLDINP